MITWVDVPVSNHDDVRIRAVRDCLGDHLSHVLASASVSAGKEPGDVGGVVDTLEVDVPGSHLGFQRVLKRRARNEADRRGFGGAPSENDHHSLAVSTGLAADHAVPEVSIKRHSGHQGQQAEKRDGGEVDHYCNDCISGGVGWISSEC